jgi:hypothetical protein
LLPAQRVLACRACKAGVVLRHLVTHIRAYHRRLYPEFGTKRSTIDWVKNRLLTSLLCELLNPFAETIPVPLSDTKAFPVLKLHVGYGCTHCPIVSKREEEIRRHHNICHAKIRRGRGGAVANSRGIMQKRLNSEHYGDQPAVLHSWSKGQHMFSGKSTREGDERCDAAATKLRIHIR